MSLDLGAVLVLTDISPLPSRFLETAPASPALRCALSSATHPPGLCTFPQPFNAGVHRRFPGAVCPVQMMSDHGLGTQRPSELQDQAAHCPSLIPSRALLASQTSAPSPCSLNYPELSLQTPDSYCPLSLERPGLDPSYPTGLSSDLPSA